MCLDQMEYVWIGGSVFGLKGLCLDWSEYV